MHIVHALVVCRENIRRHLEYMLQRNHQLLICFVLVLLLPACSNHLTKQENTKPIDVEVIELSFPLASEPEPAPQAAEELDKTNPEPVEQQEPKQAEAVVETSPAVAEPVKAAALPAETMEDLSGPVPDTPPLPEVISAPEQPGVVPKPIAANIIPESAPAPVSVPELAPETQPEPKPDSVPAVQGEPTPPVAEPEPPTPAMDMDMLGTRLRKTRAIGLFTKLELKSQVNDLLDDVEDYHASKNTLSLEQLEQRFSLLVMKLMLLLQDDDPQLHKEIAQARPALWTALADPIQFSSIKGP